MFLLVLCFRMIDQSKAAEEIFRQHGGILRMSVALEAGISRRTLYAMHANGVLERLSRGVYEYLPEKGVAAFQRAVDLSKRNSVSLGSLGFTYARAGLRPEAEALLRELQDLGKERYLSPAFIATIHAGLGQKDEAFSWLEEAFRLRSRYLVWLKVAPEYEQLRSDPRYQELMARIGLP